jgi:aldose 1-epimerase
MRQLRLADGPIEVVLLPDAGARVHRLRAFGHDLLRTPADPARHRQDPFFWGAYVMAPWCNRLVAAPIRVGDRVIRLPANFPDGSAIHGQVASAPWEVDDDGATCAIQAGGDEWPWTYECRLVVSVEAATVRMSLSLTNLADEPMPAGLGLHPWWLRPVRLALAASAVYPSNVNPPPAAGEVQGIYDLRTPSEPARGLDATWTALDAALHLDWPELGVAARLDLSGAADHVVVATPEDVDAIAVEPQTHAPDGMRRLLEGLPGGMRLIQPGERLEMGLELTVRRS